MMQQKTSSKNVTQTIMDKLYEMQKEGFLTDFRLKWLSQSPTSSYDPMAHAHPREGGVKRGKLKTFKHGGEGVDDSGSNLEPLSSKEENGSRTRKLRGGRKKLTGQRAHVPVCEKRLDEKVSEEIIGDQNLGNCFEREKREEATREKQSREEKDSGRAALPSKDESNPKSLPIHKIVLATISPHFRDIIQIDASRSEYEFPFPVTDKIIHAIVARAYGQPSTLEHANITQVLDRLEGKHDKNEEPQSEPKKVCEQNQMDSNAPKESSHSIPMATITPQMETVEPVVKKAGRKRKTQNLDSNAPRKQMKRGSTAENIWQKCQICGKMLKKTLARHMQQVHSERRPFPCKNCDKSFKTGSDLKRHKLIVHDGIRKPQKVSVMCQQCGKNFTHLGDLKHHQRAVHLQLRPYKCSSCPHSAGSRGDLNRHIQLRHKFKGLKPFQCSYCSHSCAQLSNCQKHIRLMHAGEEVKVVHLGFPDDNAKANDEELVMRDPETSKEEREDRPTGIAEKTQREIVPVCSDEPPKNATGPSNNSKLLQSKSVQPARTLTNTPDTDSKAPSAEPLFPPPKFKSSINITTPPTPMKVHNFWKRTLAKRAEMSAASATKDENCGETPAEKSEQESLHKREEMVDQQRNSVEGKSCLAETPSSRLQTTGGAPANGVADLVDTPIYRGCETTEREKLTTPVETLLSLSMQGTRRTLEISNHPDTQPVYIEDPSTKGPKVVARVIPEGSAQTSVVPFAVNKDPLQHSVPSTSHASHALVRLTEDTPDYNFPHNPTSKVPVIPQVPMIPRVPMIPQVPMIQPVPMIQQGHSLHPVSDRPELPSQTLIEANHSVVDMPLFHQDPVSNLLQIQRQEESLRDLRYIQTVIPIQTPDGRHFIALPPELDESEGFALIFTEQDATTIQDGARVTFDANLSQQTAQGSGPFIANNHFYDLAQHAILQHRIQDDFNPFHPS